MEAVYQQRCCQSESLEGHFPSKARSRARAKWLEGLVHILRIGTALAPFHPALRTVLVRGVPVLGTPLHGVRLRKHFCPFRDVEPFDDCSRRPTGRKLARHWGRETERLVDTPVQIGQREQLLPRDLVNARKVAEKFALELLEHSWGRQQSVEKRGEGCLCCLVAGDPKTRSFSHGAPATHAGLKGPPLTV